MLTLILNVAKHILVVLHQELTIRADIKHPSVADDYRSFQLDRVLQCKQLFKIHVSRSQNLIDCRLWAAVAKCSSQKYCCRG